MTIKWNEDVAPALPTRESVMNNPAVHNLTKQILKLTEGKDPVDAWYDVQLACQIVQMEMNAALKEMDTK